MGDIICLGKKAIVEICLVPESREINDEQLEKEIKESLQCDWLEGIEDIKIKVK